MKLTRHMDHNRIQCSNTRALKIVQDSNGVLSNEQKRQVAENYLGQGALLTIRPKNVGAMLAGARQDQFFTPPYIGSFLTKLIRIPRGALVYDPALGSGKMFLELAGLDNHVQVTGIEIDPEVCIIAKALLGTNAYIINDNFTNYRKINAHFTYSLGNPPMTAVLEDKQKIYKATNPNGKVPALFAFLENAILATENGGIMAFIMPTGWRNRQNGSRSFHEWFNRHIDLLLELPISGRIFFTPPHLFSANTVFSIEVYRKAGGMSKFYNYAGPVICKRLLSKGDILSLNSQSRKFLYHFCPEMRLFSHLYSKMLQEVAESSICGHLPQELK